MREGTVLLQKKVITVMMIPVDSMLALSTQLDDLREDNIPVVARMSDGLSTLTYRSRQDVEVCLYFDPDESGNPIF